MKRKIARHVLWDELKEGDEVWELGQIKRDEWGTTSNVPHFYGPFRVENAIQRTLVNPRNEIFLNMTQASIYKWEEE